MPPTEVRDRLLAAALALLREQSLTGLTQPRVAKAAGVSQSHLTYYFPTRADLLRAVLGAAAAGQRAGVAAALGGGGGPGAAGQGSVGQGSVGQRSERPDPEKSGAAEPIDRPPEAALVQALAEALSRTENTRVLVSFVLAADGDPSFRDLYRDLAEGMRAEVALMLERIGVPARPETVAMVHALGTGLAVIGLALGAEDVRPLNTAALAEMVRLVRASPPSAPDGTGAS